MSKPLSLLSRKAVSFERGDDGNVNEEEEGRGNDTNNNGFLGLVEKKDEYDDVSGSSNTAKLTPQASSNDRTQSRSINNNKKRFLRACESSSNQVRLAPDFGIAMSSSLSKKQRNHASKGPDDSVKLGKFLFAMCHFTLTFTLATLSYAILANKNKEQADVCLDYFASRAFDGAADALKKGRQAAISMASLASEMFPLSSQYPKVAIPGFERIARDLMEASVIQEMEFAPILYPWQLQEWEEFAYEYYYNRHLPQPFPNTTAVSSFGRGVWALDPQSDAPDKRVRDLGTSCRYNCTYELLVPIFQADGGPIPALLYNLHSDLMRGEAIEDMLDCSYQTPMQGYPQDHYYVEPTLASCTMLLPLSTAPSENGESPFTFIFQPVRPKKNQSQVTGMILLLTAWDHFIQSLLLDDIRGIYIVISDSSHAFTYRISDRKITVFGKGDLHDEEFDLDGKHRTLVVAAQSFLASESASYSLSLYPTQEYYDTFDSSSPAIALVGSLFIMLFIMLAFYFYQSTAQKGTLAKGDSLEARHHFMRFVSHEVRTPLNAVSMGLDVIADAIHVLSKAIQKSPNREQLLKMTEDCLCLLKMVRSGTESSVDVLSDVLSYEKIERRDWVVEATLIPLWPFLNAASEEYRSEANDKNISLLWFIHKPGEEPATKMANQEQNLAHDWSRYDSNANCELVLEEEIELPEKDSSNLCLVGDGILLRRVLHNLIGNAIHFTPDSGTICVNVVIKAAAADNGTADLQEWKTYILPGTKEKVTLCKVGKVEITVADNGAGMTLEQQQLLFGKNKTKRKTSSLPSGRGGGLGIGISKGIVERHGGWLVGRSKGVDGEGTAFRLVLPVYQTRQMVHLVQPQLLKSAVSLTEPSASSSSLSKRKQQESSCLILASEPDSGKKTLRLLIVDDALSNRKFLRRLLERKGHICEEAEDGQKAVDAIQQDRPDDSRFDCILMDYEMPNMDGPSATKVIRSLGYRVFVVGVTGNLMTQDVDYFLQCGANVVLGKPLSLPALDSVFIQNGILAPSLPSALVAENDESE